MKPARCLLTVFLAALVIWSGTATALAAQLTVSGDTDKLQMNLTEQTNLFHFRDAVPGSSQDYQLDLKNSANRSVEVLLKVETSGNGWTAAKKQLLNDIQLKAVYQASGSQTKRDVFSQGLGSLSADALLCTLPAGASGNLTLTISIPTSAGNELQDFAGKVDWTFTARMDDGTDPTQPTSPTNPTTPTSPTSPTSPTTPGRPISPTRPGGTTGGNRSPGGSSIQDTDRGVTSLTITDDDVPLAQLPDELITIPDDGVPLGGSPGTGDHRPVSLAVFGLLVSGGLLYRAFSKRK